MHFQKGANAWSLLVHVTDSKFWSAPEKDRHGINSKKSLVCDWNTSMRKRLR